MLAKNLFPSPSPVLAPFTRPAMSTNSMLVGTSFFDFDKSLKICIHRMLLCCVLFSQWTLPTNSLQLNKVLTCNLSSGTATTPMLGSIVQKGKFAACAFAFLQMALNKVDCKHKQGYLHVTCQEIRPLLGNGHCDMASSSTAPLWKHLSAHACCAACFTCLAYIGHANNPCL